MASKREIPSFVAKNPIRLDYFVRYDLLYICLRSNLHRNDSMTKQKAIKMLKNLINSEKFASDILKNVLEGILMIWQNDGITP